MNGFCHMLANAFFYAFGKLPLGLHYCLDHFLSFLIERIVKYRVPLVEENLSKAFPDKDIEWVKRTRHEFYRHFARVIHQAIWFGACRDGRQALKDPGHEGRLHKSRLVVAKNPEVLGKLWENAPSVIIMSSHSGNWEVSGGICQYNYSGIDNHVREERYFVIHRKQSSAFWDEFLKRNRTCVLEHPDTYPGYLESGELLRYILSHRNEKIFYNLITDQRPYFHCADAERITFMNRTCCTMTGGAAIAHKLGLAVVYQRMAVNENGKGYSLEYVPICEDASKMEVMDIIGRYYELLEGDLKAQPFNYLWTHNRWLMPM